MLEEVKRKKSSGAIGVRQIFRVSQEGTESFKEFVIFVIVDESSTRVSEDEVTLHEAHDRFTVAPSLESTIQPRTGDEELSQSKSGSEEASVKETTDVIQAVEIHNETKVKSSWKRTEAAPIPLPNRARNRFNFRITGKLRKRPKAKQDKNR